MVKRLLYILAFICVSFSITMPASASASIELMEINETSNVSILVKGKILHVSGANGKIVQIYNIAGMCVKQHEVDGQDVRIELNLPKGCYMVKIGNTVRKIFIS